MIGLYIILAVFAAFIFWIHSGHQKEEYGEDVIKNWPQAEGTINFTVSDAVGTHWYIDFIVNGQLLQGESIIYRKCSGRYRSGDKVSIRYEMLGHSNRIFNGRVVNATAVIEDKELYSLDKEFTRTYYKGYLLAMGFVVFDVVLIVIEVLQRFGVI